MKGTVSVKCNWDKVVKRAEPFPRQAEWDDVAESLARVYHKLRVLSATVYVIV